MRPILRNCSISARCLVFATGVVLVIFRDVEATTIVVPPALENEEGNTLYADVPAPSTGVRFHEVVPALDFSQTLPEPGMLTQMAFRPDNSVRASRTINFHDFELRLSTTDRGPGSLSSRFDDNFGIDTTVVYSGDLTMSTQGSGPTAGPREFDYIVEFLRALPLRSRRRQLACGLARTLCRRHTGL